MPHCAQGQQFSHERPALAIGLGGGCAIGHSSVCKLEAVTVLAPLLFCMPVSKHFVCQLLVQSDCSSRCRAPQQQAPAAAEEGTARMERPDTEGADVVPSNGPVPSTLAGQRS